MHATFSVSGQLIDLFRQEIYPARVTVAQGKIASIERLTEADAVYILPGFVDAHIHIESSLLVPSEFAKAAVVHGTVATVSDPHEIANVCGVAGVDYMIANAATSPLKIFFGAPSCVPATGFETAGAALDVTVVTELLSRKDIHYLSEMMNFPGVLLRDEAIMAKIAAANRFGKPIDGHAPGLKGLEARQYAEAGISTDHECSELQEALDKIAAGMLIQIREGSAARNFDALISLLQIHPGKVMFCSDDKHPDELLQGHINVMVQRALALGYSLFDVLHAACVLPVQHYNLPVGLLRQGDPADFIVVNNLTDFRVGRTFIDGVLVSREGVHQIPDDDRPIPVINNFSRRQLVTQDFRLELPKVERVDKVQCRVIDACEGLITTLSSEAWLPFLEGAVYPDVDQDVIKIGIVNRYHDAPVILGFVRNFGLKRGALASSVAHDSHNIVFVGVDDDSIAQAVNSIIEQKGGICAAEGSEKYLLPLPVAGLMTDKDALQTASAYEQLNDAAYTMGCRLKAPFMTLSFMALPVIPALKITDKGLFDVNAFDFTDVVIGA